MGTRAGHILIVDDDPLNRRLLEKSLEASGHRTTAADNGFAGLSSIDDDAPDLIRYGCVRIRGAIKPVKQEESLHETLTKREERKQRYLDYKGHPGIGAESLDQSVSSWQGG